MQPEYEEVCCLEKTLKWSKFLDNHLKSPSQSAESKKTALAAVLNDLKLKPSAQELGRGGN